MEVELNSKVISELIEDSKRTGMTVEEFMKRYDYNIERLM